MLFIGVAMRLDDVVLIDVVIQLNSIAMPADDVAIYRRSNAIH